MTRPSWTGRGRNSTGPLDGGGRPTIRLWHVSCIGLLSTACIYPFPWRGAEQNLPPELLVSSDSPGTTIQVGPAGRTVWVAARDPDGDNISFAWYLSSSGPVYTAHPDNVFGEDGEASSLDLTPDTRLDGQTLTCTWWDAGTGQRSDVSWTLEVP